MIHSVSSFSNRYLTNVFKQIFNLKKMKKTIKLFIWLILLLPISQSKAQITGYGTGASGSKTHSSGVFYTDNLRAEVTSISSCGLDATINISSATGTFAIGDEALIIQMKGGTVGRHQNVWVVSGTCSPLANLKLTAVNGTMLSYSVGSGCNLQLIKIHRC